MMNQLATDIFNLNSGRDIDLSRLFDVPVLNDLYDLLRVEADKLARLFTEDGVQTDWY